MLKKLLSLGVLTLMAMSIISPVHAIFGEEYLVLAQQLTELKSQTKHLKDQLDYALKNLQSMDSSVRNAAQLNLKSTMAQIVKCLDDTDAMTFQYGKLQVQWDRTYKKFEDYNNGMSASDYAKDANQVLQQTRNAMYHAAEAQGLVGDIKNDEQLLYHLQRDSTSADGALKAAQAGNAILALQTKQLMRQQTIMATSYRAQTLYYENLMQQQTAASAAASNSQLKAPDCTRTGNPNGMVKFE